MIPFGRMISVGNFYVIKRNKSLSKAQLAEIRKSKAYSEETKRQFKRVGLPFIKISTVSENWSMEIACNMDIFKFIDDMNVYGVGNVEAQNKLQIGSFTEESKESLIGLFRMLYCDCTILGDSKYWEDKVSAINEYTQRMSSPKKEETAEEKEKDDKILREEEAKFNAQNNMKNTAKIISMNGKENENE